MESGDRTETRARIVDAAARLLRASGTAAVTTRGTAEAAGVQAPTIYRLFGDKDGLLEAVAEHLMATHVATKTEAARRELQDAADPVDDLRASWVLQIEFAVANPAIFRLLSDPARVSRSPAARAGRRVLEARIGRIAAAGRLRVGERRAVDLLQAAGTGTAQTLLAQEPEERDAGLADAMLGTVLDRILVEGTDHSLEGSVAAMVALRALAPRLEALTGAERRLLAEWLDRAIPAG